MGGPGQDFHKFSIRRNHFLRVSPEVVPVRQGGAMAIAWIGQEEWVRLDPQRIAGLFSELGPAGAERLIGAAIEDLAVQLAQLRALAPAGPGPAADAWARALSDLAGQVGLSGLSRVARDVADCAARADPAAFGATLARLLRIGDRSLVAVWDLHDQRP